MGAYREFYTGWLTHWGELLAQTDAASTALALDNVLHLNASVVLYVSSSLNVCPGLMHLCTILGSFGNRF